MADEEKDEAVKGAAPSPADDGSKKLIMVMVVLSALVVVLTPLAVLFTVKAFAADGGAPNEGKKIEAFYEMTMEELTVNIRDTQGTRFVKFEVTLHYNVKEMSGLFVKKEAKNHSILKIIEAKIIDTISEKNLPALTNNYSKIQLKKEIKIALNEIIREYSDSSGMITNVIFSRYLIQ